MLLTCVLPSPWGARVRPTCHLQDRPSLLAFDLKQARLHTPHLRVDKRRGRRRHLQTTASRAHIRARTKQPRIIESSGTWMPTQGVSNPALTSMSRDSQCTASPALLAKISKSECAGWRERRGWLTGPQRYFSQGPHRVRCTESEEQLLNIRSLPCKNQLYSLPKWVTWKGSSVPWFPL